MAFVAVAAFFFFEMLLEPVAGNVELEDDAASWTSRSIRGGGRHRVLEEIYALLPLREREVARQHHASTFISLCEKSLPDSSPFSA